MRIAYLSLNRENMPDPVPPLGLLYIHANSPEGHDKELWDLCFEEDPLGTLRRKIRRFQPDMIAVSMRNIHNATYTGWEDNLQYYERVFGLLRETTDARLVLGGGGFSVMPRELMQHLRPDFGISGEGERGFALLVERLEAGSHDFEGVPSLHYFADDASLVSNAERAEGREIRRHMGPMREQSAELVSLPPMGFAALDELAAPDHGLLDPRYFESCGIGAVQTKRGCPLRCDYCTYPLIEGRSIRRRDPARVVDELFALRDAQPALHHVFIVDSVFNLPPEHAKDVCREMIRRDFDVPWTCYANPIGFDESLAQLMAEAGCAGMEIGTDSGCDEILKTLRKGFDTARVREMHQQCKNHGLPDCHTFMIGTPGESLDHVRRTLDFCTELDPFAAILLIWKDDHEAMDPPLRAERDRFREEINQLMAEKHRDFPRWIIPTLSINFDRQLFDKFRHFGMQGPLWQHLTRVDPRSRYRRPRPLAPSPMSGF